MNYNEIRNFLENVEEYNEQEIMSNLQYIITYLQDMNFWDYTKKYLTQVFKVADKEKVLYELFKNKKKFSFWNKKLDFPEKLKFGVEIEVADLPFEELQDIFETNTISEIMKILEVPINISNKIIQNSDFEKENEFDKWIFSPEAGNNESEASSPIMKNDLDDLNQIVAICTLLKSLNASLHGGTGLHINVGADYLECNEKAIENILKIWGECEELFFKMANPEGEIIRVEASNMAIPIKENIQHFFKEDGSVTLNTEEDMERLLYQIQAQNRMDDIVAWSGFGLEEDLDNAKVDEERFKVYQKYEKSMRNKGDSNSKVRWTSINFNHMKWNTDNPGRVEIRIFNSSLEPEIIFQDLLLVGKIFDTSLENARNTDYKKEEFKKLFLRDVSETTKVNNLLNLLFENEEQKNIFKKRWESVKDKKEYKKYQSGSDTFER